MSPDEQILVLEREAERLRRAIGRHRKAVQCCQECGDALVADARAKRKASADARLWAALPQYDGDPS